MSRSNLPHMNGTYERFWRALEALALSDGNLKRRLEIARDELRENDIHWVELPESLRADAQEICAGLATTPLTEMSEAAANKCASQILELVVDLHAATMQQVHDFVEREDDNVDS